MSRNINTGSPWSFRIRPLSPITSTSRTLPGIPGDAKGIPGLRWTAISGSPMFTIRTRTRLSMPAPACSAAGTMAPGSGRRRHADLVHPAAVTRPPIAGTEAADFSNPWVYDTSIVPEAFMDTTLVNGNPYPYLTVEPTAYRFRMLNACNDRNLNLSMFVADTGGAAGATATATLRPAR